MIVLRPDEVRFGSQTWTGVIRVAIDRTAASAIEQWDAHGPHSVYADVARQRVLIRITQEIRADDLAAPIPGAMQQLSLTAAAGSDANRQRLTVNAVVESVQNKITDFGATRTIALLAVSDRGDEDPITITAP